jgi:hypothetical protein
MTSFLARTRTLVFTAIVVFGVFYAVTLLIAAFAPVCR